MMTNPSFFTALRRGLRGKCPRCGSGKLFRAFLKVNDHCPACGEEYAHHRADDMPAWLVILITGHIVLPLVMWVEMTYEPPTWVHVALWVPFCAILTTGLLQPVKGMIVALQWHIGLHGFAEAKRQRIARFQNKSE